MNTFLLRNMDMKEDCLQPSDNGEQIVTANTYMATHLNLSLNLVLMNWMKTIGSLILVDSKSWKFGSGVISIKIGRAHV